MGKDRVKLRFFKPLCLLAWIALGGNVAAHTSLVEETAPADGYYRVRFLVAHGCDTSPTHTVRVQIPKGVEFLSDPVSAPDAAAVVCARDPDGILIEFVQLFEDEVG